MSIMFMFTHDTTSSRIDFKAKTSSLSFGFILEEKIELVRYVRVVRRLKR